MACARCGSVHNAVTGARAHGIVAMLIRNSAHARQLFQQKHC